MNNHLLHFRGGSSRLKSSYFRKVLFLTKFLSTVSMVLSEKQAFGGSNCHLRKTVEGRVTSVKVAHIFKGEKKTKA